MLPFHGRSKLAGIVNIPEADPTDEAQEALTHLQKATKAWDSYKAIARSTSVIRTCEPLLNEAINAISALGEGEFAQMRAEIDAVLAAAFVEPKPATAEPARHKLITPPRRHGFVHPMEFYRRLHNARLDHQRHLREVLKTPFYWDGVRALHLNEGLQQVLGVIHQELTTNPLAHGLLPPGGMTLEEFKAAINDNLLYQTNDDGLTVKTTRPAGTWRVTTYLAKFYSPMTMYLIRSKAQ